MAKNKTIETSLSVDAYVNSIADESRRKDIAAIIALIQKLTKLPAKMWGTAIVGFGSYHYKYESGREGDAPLAGLAFRVNAIVLYLALDEEQRETLLPVFGKHKTSKGCIYIQKLQDVDIAVLSKMIRHSITNSKKKDQA